MEAITLLMSKNTSATEATCMIRIVDTVVWEQTCHLPLKLDKIHQNSLPKVKKLQSQTSNLPTILETYAHGVEWKLMNALRPSTMSRRILKANLSMKDQKNQRTKENKCKGDRQQTLLNKIVYIDVHDVIRVM